MPGSRATAGRRIFKQRSRNSRFSTQSWEVPTEGYAPFPFASSSLADGFSFPFSNHHDNYHVAIHRGSFFFPLSLFSLPPFSSRGFSRRIAFAGRVVVQGMFRARARSFDCGCSWPRSLVARTSRGLSSRDIVVYD